MSNVHTFAPRRPAPAPKTRSPIDHVEIRRLIEEAAHHAYDTAERLIAILDQMDGDPDREDGFDAEPSLGAPENHHASQIIWLRGSSSDCEQEVTR